MFAGSQTVPDFFMTTRNSQRIRIEVMALNIMFNKYKLSEEM